MGKIVLLDGHRAEIRTVEQVAELLDPRKAQLAVAGVLAALGHEFDWSADTLDCVVEAISGSGVLADTGLPAVFDQDDDALEFWDGLS
ncbi:hypothetical protein [Mycolicibacterium sphagni]|uniref:hypothetical protein n=1 Tax=Mycolicibacterium sphagni TaxID=1786 RepID=UPI0021F27F67|nr:hypothetical protein [Mycolicibacterium sphagni]MCV7174834.1 hypothetical protein [Mycolicibacterium sphagni]